jgi:hypothetical protein
MVGLFRRLLASGRCSDFAFESNGLVTIRDQFDNAFTGPAASDAMMLAPALGALTSRLRTVHQLNPECWRYTPKGDVDRTAVRKTMVRFP